MSERKKTRRKQHRGEKSENKENKAWYFLVVFRQSFGRSSSNYFSLVFGRNKK